MTHIIVKDGAVSVSGGRVVTDAGGAPCCCDPGGGCWLILLPCNCDCPIDLRVMRLNAATDAAWPKAQREVGTVIEVVTGGCFRLLGLSVIVPTGAVEISPQSIVTIHPDCDESPCDDEPCTDIGGFSFGIVGGRFPCLPYLVRTDCLARIRVEWYRAGHIDYQDRVGGGSVFERAFGYAKGEYSLVLNDRGTGWRLGDWVINNRLVGIYDASVAGGSVRQWNIEQELSSDRDSLLDIRGNVNTNNIAAGFIPFRPVSGVIPRTTFNATEGLPLLNELPCNSRLDFGADNEGADGYITHSSTLTPSFGWQREFSFAVYPAEDRIRNSTETLIRVLEMELIDGTVLNFNNCDIPVPSIAVACDVDADPQEITYDAQLLPEWAESLIEIETGLRYIPTGIPSNDTPLPVVYEGEGCPEPPIDDSDLYYIAQCGSNTPVEQIPQLGEPGGPAIVNRTVAYQPGDGLVAGEGWVPITLLGPNGCLFAGRGQPTTIPYPANQQPDIVFRSDSGTCRGAPFVNADPRSQCQQTDGGGGGTIPDSPNLTALSDSTDTGSMGLGDAVERAIKTITLNQLATCPACQRRKEVLNQFGLTVGRAVLRRLGW